MSIAVIGSNGKFELKTEVFTQSVMFTPKRTGMHYVFLFPGGGSTFSAGGASSFGSFASQVGGAGGGTTSLAHGIGGFGGGGTSPTRPNLVGLTQVEYNSVFDGLLDVSNISLGQRGGDARISQLRPPPNQWLVSFGGSGGAGANSGSQGGSGGQGMSPPPSGGGGGGATARGRAGSNGAPSSNGAPGGAGGSAIGWIIDGVSGQFGNGGGAATSRSPSDVRSGGMTGMAVVHKININSLDNIPITVGAAGAGGPAGNGCVLVCYY